MKKADKSYTFDWVGKNARGRVVRGQISEATTAAARLALKKQNITVIKVNKRITIGFLAVKKISSMDITVFSRQIATMMRSGLTMIKSLDAVAQSTSNLKFKNLIYSIKNDVEGGATLAEALAKHPLYFDNLYCSLVKSGENSGKLDQMLERIASYKEKNESIKLKVKKAMKYPITVILASVVVTILLLLKVIPVFKELFESFDSELPAFTQMVVDVSEFTEQYWVLMVLAAIIGYFLIKSTIQRSIAVQHMIQRASLKLPIFGDLFYKAVIARFSSTLATNYAANVPLIEGLRASGEATGNIAYQETIHDMALDVESGQSLSFAMKQTRMFPPFCEQLLEIGDEAGELEQMLDRIASHYEEEVDLAVDGLTSMMEPLVMVLLGLLVGGLVVAMYLPIFQMGSVV